MTPRDRAALLAAKALLIDSHAHAWAVEAILRGEASGHRCTVAGAVLVALANGRRAEALQAVRDLLAAEVTDA